MSPWNLKELDRPRRKIIEHLEDVLVHTAQSSLTQEQKEAVSKLLSVVVQIVTRGEEDA